MATPPLSVVVFDCETDCGFERLCGYSRDAFVRQVMQFTCVCALEVSAADVWQATTEEARADALRKARRHTFWRDRAEAGKTPVDDLLALFDRAVLIVGYNVLNFDFPLLQRFYRPTEEATAAQRYRDHRAKTHDLMARVKDVTETYHKLDHLLKQNGLPLKTGSGADAPRLWADDRREELEAYCAADVDVTARLALQPTVRVGEHALAGNSDAVHGMRAALAAQLAHRAPPSAWPLPSWPLPS